MRLFSQDSHTMADIADISDDEFEEIPIRKPIGWNYQNSNKSELMVGKIKSKNSEIDSEIAVAKSSAIIRIPSSDDIEVLEIVDKKKSSQPKPLFPESSSRKDLLNMTRKCNKQASIEKFLNPDQGKNKVKHNKFSFNRRVKFDSSSLQNKEVFNHQNNNYDKNNLPNAHKCNGDSGIISNDNIKNETKLNLVNPAKPECPLVRIKLSCDNEKEVAVIIPEAANEEMNKTAIKKEALAIPGTSAATKEIDSDITSEYSKTLFENFIAKWKCLEGYGGDDFSIYDKLWKHYRLCHSSYTHSRKFCNGLNKAITEVNSDNKYRLIKDIIDTLKMYKDTPYIEKEEDPNEWFRKTLKSSEKGDNAEVALSEEDLRNQWKLKRLEKAMIKTHKKIQALETKEVDLDDSDNSSYLLLDRYKIHFMELDDRYCKLANCSPATGRPVEKKFKYEGSRYPEINQRITAWVNKHREFPEYVDVLKLVKEVTKTSCLPLRPETVRVKAQEIFRDVGKMLKERRQKDDMFSIYAYAGDDLNVDPADADPVLYKQLKVNEKAAKEKLDKVFKHFYEKDLEERDKTGTKIKKDGDDEKVVNAMETETEDKKNSECDLDKDVSDKNKNEIDFEEECKTSSNGESDNDDEENGTLTESESDPNTVNTFENGKLSDTSDNKNAKCEISKLKVRKSIFAGGSERVSLDISDNSDDEEIIETASNDSFLPKKELDTIEEEKINGIVNDFELNDVSSECSEEDILIADSPDPLAEIHENVSYRPDHTSNVALSNSRKRKLDLPLKLSKKSHIESSPEIVELD